MTNVLTAQRSVDVINPEVQLESVTGRDSNQKLLFAVNAATFYSRHPPMHPYQIVTDPLWKEGSRKEGSRLHGMVHV
jgi:hypothetical protein